MRLTTFILIIALAQVSAKGFGQKITLNTNNTPIEKVIQTIRDQSGYRILYDANDLKDQQVSLKLNSVDVEEAIKQMLKGLPISYKIVDKNIVLNKEDPTFLERLAERWASIDIRGRVVDSETGQALAGASVKVKGTNRSVSTNAQGAFYLQNVDEDAVIEISFVGYLSRELKAGKELGEIKLVMGNSELDAVQVIAYGTTTKRLNIGNISSIKGETLQKQPVTNPLLALQGRVPGVVITQANGTPGSPVQVLMQGRGSLNSGVDPFFVIDGVPYVSKLGGTISGINAAGGSPLNFINMADIERIDFLKDADATSIYGSRAANGAVLITTRKGRPEQAAVDINFQQGWGKVSKMMDLLNTTQYLQMRREALANNNNAAILPTDYDINGFWDTTRNVNWQKKLIGGTAGFTNVQASLSGGSKETQFLIGTGYIREGTVIPVDFANTKGSVNLNINHRSSDNKFKLYLTAGYVTDKNKLPRFDFTPGALSLAPNAPELNHPDGSVNWAITPGGVTSFYNNPMVSLLKDYERKANNLISSIGVGYEFIPGLKLSGSFGFNKLSIDERTTEPLSSFDPNSSSKIRSATFSTNNVVGYIIEPQLTYTRKFGSNELNALLGGTYQQSFTDYQALSGSGYLTDVEMLSLRGAASIIPFLFTQTKYRYNAGFARINYIRDERYIVTLAGRRDGSSRFGPENRFHNFYSIAAGWIFSEEQFLKGNLGPISFGKLKGSYGTSGNDQIPDYSFLSLFTTVGGVLPYQGLPALIPSSHANPYLQWELTKKLNLGLELGFLTNKIRINANCYQNTCSNQLVLEVLPIHTGFQTVNKNFVAKFRNYGWEIELNSTPIQAGDFSWQSDFNITVPKNKLIEFPGLATNVFYANRFVIGQPTNVSLLFKHNGVNKDNGQNEYISEKGEITTSPSVNFDKIVRTNINPRVYGGWHNSFRYKGLELDFLVRYNRQKDLASFVQLGNSNTGRFNNNQPIALLNRWHKAGDEAYINKITSNTAYSQNESLFSSSDRALADVSFISLENASISYTIPQAWIKKLSLMQANIFMQGQNLLTFTSFKGLNPENPTALSIPPLRMITLGMRVKL